MQAALIRPKARGADDFEAHLARFRPFCQNEVVGKVTVANVKHRVNSRVQAGEPHPVVGLDVVNPFVGIGRKDIRSGKTEGVFADSFTPAGVYKTKLDRLFQGERLQWCFLGAEKGSLRKENIKAVFVNHELMFFP
ncbi:MAG: hypothetical protein ACOY7U_04710 [Acidobacteriota bacterium]